jgi:hypothetical protein
LFEDFEFKPLTEGLGFHKKAEKIKSDIRSSQLGNDSLTSGGIPDRPPMQTMQSLPQRPTLLNNAAESDLLGRDAPKSAGRATQSISDLINSLPPSLDFVDQKGQSLRKAPNTVGMGEPPAGARPQIYQPLAREEYKPLPKPPQATAQAATPAMPAAGATAAGPATTVMGNASPYRERMNESFAKAFPHAEREKKKVTPKEKPAIMATAGHLGAGILDAMVVTGVATILLVCILAITKVNLVALLTNAQTDGPTQIHLALLFIAVLQLYLLTARSFFGASLGEWAFEMQLGTRQDQDAALYPLLVAWRTILVTVTGLILMPILSVIFRRDLLSYLTGLQLYRRN